MIHFQIYRPGQLTRTIPTEIGGYPAIVDILSLPEDAGFTINILTMAAGDKIMLEDITEPLIGAYLSSGSLIDQSQTELQFNGEWTTEWIDNPRTGLFTAGNQGASWLCLQGKGSVQLVSGSAIIPHGTAVVIAKGFEGYPLYSKPTSVTGEGDMLLVTI